MGVPVGLAAFFLRIPIVLHESDSVMGQANRFLSRFAKKIAVSFPLNTYRSLSPLLRHKLIYTGLPISNEFRTISPFRHHATPPALLVTGGSQGARQINNLIVGVLPKLLNKYRLIHLSGELDYPHLAEIRHQLPKALQESYELYPFKPLSEALPQADLVVSRAGATTLFELAAAGKPAILIPLPHSANHHQEKNAQFFADHKAALLLRGRETTPSKLLSLIQRLLKGNQERRALSHQIKTLDQREAVKKLTQLVLE